MGASAPCSAVSSHSAGASLLRCTKLPSYGQNYVCTTVPTQTLGHTHVLLSGARVMLTVVVVVVKEVKASSNKGSTASEADRGNAAFEQICKLLGK